MKPFMNLDELEFESSEQGIYGESWAVISDRIGAKKLGYSLTILPPGKRVCPYHNHRIDEEMFFILEGSGTLRFGDQTYPVRANDIIACPPGDRSVAHQIVNTGDVPMKFLALSTREQHDICEYPDANKVGVFCRAEGREKMRHFFKVEQAVDYFEGEQGA